MGSRSTPRRAVVLACVPLLLVACTADDGGDAADEEAPTIDLAAGRDVETVLLAETMAALLAREDVDARVEGFDDLLAARRALEFGVVDAMPGYTGAAWLEVLGRPDPPSDPRASFGQVRQFDLGNDIEWMTPTFADEPGLDRPPADATFAMVVRSAPFVTVQPVAGTASALVDVDDATPDGGTRSDGEGSGADGSGASGSAGDVGSGTGGSAGDVGSGASGSAGDAGPGVGGSAGDVGPGVGEADASGSGGGADGDTGSAVDGSDGSGSGRAADGEGGPADGGSAVDAGAGSARAVPDDPIVPGGNRGATIPPGAVVDPTAQAGPVVDGAAPVVVPVVAEEVSQLASLLAEAPDAALCLDEEFVGRPDGASALFDAYAIDPERAIVGAAPAAAVEGVVMGACVAGLTTATDGAAWAANLRPLVDDRGVFPSFVVTVLARAELRATRPEVLEAWEPLADQLTTRLLARHNARVVAGDPVEEVASDLAAILWARHVIATG